MKLTKNQQAIVNCIKANGRVWINEAITRAIFQQHMKLVDKGVLTWTIDNDGGIWFDLAD